MAKYKDFEIVFQEKWLTIGKLGGREYFAYYILTTDQRAVSGSIALEISKEEYEQIRTAADPLATAEPIYRREMYAGAYVPID